MPGPTAMNGTRMSESNAVPLPGSSWWSPMWKPLSEANTKTVRSVRPRSASFARMEPTISSTETTERIRLR